MRGSYGALTGSTWRLLPRKISPVYCRVSYVAVTRIPLLVLRNTWHYVIIRYSYGEIPKSLSCVAHTRRLYAKVWPRHYAGSLAGRAFAWRCDRILILRVVATFLSHVHPPCSRVHDNVYLNIWNVHLHSGRQSIYAWCLSLLGFYHCWNKYDSYRSKWFESKFLSLWISIN